MNLINHMLEALSFSARKPSRLTVLLFLVKKTKQKQKQKKEKKEKDKEKHIHARVSIFL